MAGVWTRGSGEVELLAGDPDAAETALAGASYETLERFGEQRELVDDRGVSGRGAVRSGAIDEEAERLTEASEQATSSDDFIVAGRTGAINAIRESVRRPRGSSTAASGSHETRWHARGRNRLAEPARRRSHEL